MNKLTIPTILVATVMVAGMFAFMPVEKASTVHLQVIAGSVGVGCVTDTLTVAGAIDNDLVIFTFSNEGAPIYIISLSGQVTTGGIATEAFGIQLGQDVGAGETEVDGVVLTLILDDDAADAPDITERDMLSSALAQENGIFVETVLQLVIDDDESAGTDIEAADVLTFEICGLVSDPANFDAADVTITQTAGT